MYTVHIHLQTPGFRFAPLLLTNHSQLLRGTCAACLIHVLGSACQSGNPFKEVYSTISSFHQMTKGQASTARVASQNRIGWNSFRVPKALCGLGSHRTVAPQQGEKATVQKGLCTKPSRGYPKIFSGSWASKEVLWTLPDVRIANVDADAG